MNEQLCVRGRYDEALESIENIDQESIRSIKVYQYWANYVGLLKLKKAVARLVVLDVETE